MVSQHNPKKVEKKDKTIGERLREERSRLRMTQQEFGSAGGVRTDAQYKYESGLRIPRADYLAEISKVGADIYYVVTGNHLPLG
jgi:transcriptional regulator with XRE-family HTH domain